MGIPTFISLIYCIENEQGHYLAYNHAIQQCVEQLGWRFQAWIRALADLREMPPHWSKVLGHPVQRTGPFKRIYKLLDLIRSQRALLNRLRTETDGPVILFSDWFDTIHLISITFVLLTSRIPGNLQFWAHFHRPIRGFARVQRLLLTLLEWRLGKRCVQRLCISSALLEPLSEVLHSTVHVLPMPYRERWKAHAPIRKPSEARRILLWPGTPNTSKGLHVIRRLAVSTDAAAECYTLVVGDRSSIPEYGAMHIGEMGIGITREEFVSWYETADAVMLPYSADVYAHMVSSIFIEAICAGCRTFVSAETSMAHELRRAGLHEYVLDWSRSDALMEIHRLLDDDLAHARFDQLRKEYQAKFSVDGCTAVIQSLYEASA